MARIAWLGVAVVTLLPLGGCVGICTDSRGEAIGRSFVPFSRRYFMCDGGHCNDAAGMHIDQRCSCSPKCGCWGTRVGTARTDADESATPCTGCAG